MEMILFFDTETSGLPDWKTPSGSPHQPHIVQLAAILADPSSKKVIKEMQLIIKPDGWKITAETTRIHGITNERALKFGVPEKDVLEMLIAMWSGRKRVAHNRTFDQRIIRIAMKRFCNEETTEAWADKEGFDCTMLMAKPIMKMLPKNRYGFKNPKLEEAYKYFTGKDLVGAHSAMADTKACMEIYWYIKKDKAYKGD